jgi:hypothetical protein
VDRSDVALTGSFAREEHLIVYRLREHLLGFESVNGNIAVSAT